MAKRPPLFLTTTIVTPQGTPTLEFMNYLIRADLDAEISSAQDTAQDAQEFPVGVVAQINETGPVQTPASVQVQEFPV